MGKNSGYIVTTKTGFNGRTKHGDKLVNGKVIVYLEENHKPVLDEKGVQKKILCNHTDLKIEGYAD
jgi:hypothetical protein